MNEVKNTSKKKGVYAVLAFTFIAISFLILIFATISCIEYVAGKNVKPEEKQIVVADIKSENLNIFIISADGNKYELWFEQSESFSVYEMSQMINQPATLYLVNYGRPYVIGIESSTYTLDKNIGLKNYKSALLGSMVASIVLEAIFIFLSILMLILFIKQPNPQQKMAEGIYAPWKEVPLPIIKLKKQNTMVLSILVLIGAIIFPIFIAFSIVNSINENVSNIIGGCTALFCIIISILIIVWMVKYYKKTIKYYVDYYKFDISNKDEYQTNDIFIEENKKLYFKLSKNKLSFSTQYREEYENKIKENLNTNNKLVTENNEIRDNVYNDLPSFDIKFEDITFYTKALLKNYGGIINIFIVADLENYPIKQIAFSLDSDLYFWIKKYDIKVDGLESCIDNIEKLLKQQNRIVPTLVTFKENKKYIEIK